VVSLQSVDPSADDSAMMELEQHTRIIEQLLEIAAETDLNLDESAHQIYMIMTFVIFY